MVWLSFICPSCGESHQPFFSHINEIDGTTLRCSCGTVIELKAEIRSGIRSYMQIGLKRKMMDMEEGRNKK